MHAGKRDDELSRGFSTGAAQRSKPTGILNPLYMGRGVSRGGGARAADRRSRVTAAGDCAPRGGPLVRGRAPGGRGPGNTQDVRRLHDHPRAKAGRARAVAALARRREAVRLQTRTQDNGISGRRGGIVQTVLSPDPVALCHGSPAGAPGGRGGPDPDRPASPVLRSIPPGAGAVIRGIRVFNN